MVISSHLFRIIARGWPGQSGLFGWSDDLRIKSEEA
jgi:hypothetical protein